jgi:hypothetical protein
METACGPADPRTAKILAGQAETLLRLGRSSDALPLARRGAEAMELTYGPDYPDFSAALTILVAAMVDLDMPDEALPPDAARAGGRGGCPRTG